MYEWKNRWIWHCFMLLLKTPGCIRQKLRLIITSASHRFNPSTLLKTPGYAETESIFWGTGAEFTSSHTRRITIYCKVPVALMFISLTLAAIRAMFSSYRQVVWSFIRWQNLCIKGPTLEKCREKVLFRYVLIISKSNNN